MEILNLDNHAANTGASNKNFGITFGVIFSLLTIYLYQHHQAAYVYAAGLSVAVFLAVFITPQILTPFNKVWTKLGLLLSMIMNPIILGVVFFAVVVPIGIYLKITKKGSIKLQNSSASYWNVRNQENPINFEEQF